MAKKYINALSGDHFGTIAKADFYSLPYLYFCGYSQSVPRKIKVAALQKPANSGSCSHIPKYLIFLFLSNG